VERAVVVTRRRSIVAATRAELEAGGKLQSALGSVALVIAERLDKAEDPGSAMAAMAKELRATMAELAKLAPSVADPVDELKRRRQERRSG
jgi:hypothetical protein